MHVPFLGVVVRRAEREAVRKVGGFIKTMWLSASDSLLPADYGLRGTLEPRTRSGRVSTSAIRHERRRASAQWSTRFAAEEDDSTQR
jgi:hypothetical protein